MGGLLPGWNSFRDPLNSINRPAQMGPMWMQAQAISGMPVQHIIWMNQPPASSYLACIAVKAAGIQTTFYGERMLRLIREKIMIEGENTTTENKLLTVAEQLSLQYDFDKTQFAQDLRNGKGSDLFREDLKEVQFYNIKRFPTFIFRDQVGGKIITGYQSYSMLENHLLEIKNVEPDNAAVTIEEYENYWGSLCQKEKMEMGFEDIAV